jgi:hypothetical protein
MRTLVDYFWLKESVAVSDPVLAVEITLTFTVHATYLRSVGVDLRFVGQDCDETLND